MTPDTLYSAIHAAPFVPFRVHLANGRTVDVWHPEYLFHAQRGRSAVWMDTEGSYRILDVALIVELELNPKPQSPFPHQPKETETR